ncbi:MAG: hypothetical protein E4G90_01220 [Gemmatimonadales bacterium]|nr:MAG: hypothetical protein E4G90_01220 [Gemmatimonadales bacterium]
MDFDALLESSELGLGDREGGEVVTQSMRDLKEAPRFLSEPLLAAYVQGGAMVHRIKAKGGWPAVEALYGDPPRSSEQVLHPEKLGKDLPVDVRFPSLPMRLPTGWTLKEEDVLGEIGIRVLLENWRDPEWPDVAGVHQAAAGWGGDRYGYFTGPGGKGEVLIWRTVWDTAEDAQEFSLAYCESLRVRFPKMKSAPVTRGASDVKTRAWEVEPGRVLSLAVRDREVDVIDATDRSLLDVLRDVAGDGEH